MAARNAVFRGLCLLGLVFSLPAYSANWLKLQGTEPTATAARAKVWGFVQAQYQHDFSATNSADKYIPAKLIGPNLTSQNMFNVNRARIGVRGSGFPIDSKINYFILAELGNNGLTHGGDRVKLTDASVTLNHIPYLRIRAGLFKYPGSEEGLQAIHAADYINFTTVTNQLMLERFPNDDNYYKTQVNGTFRGNTETQYYGTPPNGFEKPVGGFRDVGVQVFDWIDHANWEHTYAVMLGNGNGLNLGDNNANKTLYAYWSSEWLFDGSSSKKEGIKAFAWYQTGKRAYDQDFSYSQDTAIDPNTNISTTVYRSGNVQDWVYYNRTRAGVGVKYNKKPFRVVFEYLQGNGMIFLGSHKESFDMNTPGGNGDGLTGKANGWYLDVGWKVLDMPLELDFRYDVYNRLTGDPLEVNFSTATIGGQYFINKKTRFTLNYAYRNGKSATGNSTLEDNLSALGGRLAAQFTALF